MEPMTLYCAHYQPTTSSMGKRVPREAVVGLLKVVFDTEFVKAITINRYDIPVRGRVFVSQSQPSRTSKGHWDYDFFHTITDRVIEEVMEGSGTIVLINYVDQTYSVLRPPDIAWAIRHSSRPKGYGEQVTDFVVEETDEGHCLRPYDRFSPYRRSIEVKAN